MKKNRLFTLFFRYLILIILGIIFSFSSILYNFFLILTIYPVYFLLSLVYEVLISQNYLFLDSIYIEIIPACVAVSAYFLLLILNLTTPMNNKQRIYSIIFSILALLLVNILRIFTLTIFLINGFIYFEIVHKALWYFLSIIFVVGIWFLNVYLFKIKNIPAYSDIKSMVKMIKKK